MVGDIVGDLKDELEVELKRFLEHIDNQSDDDRLAALKALFDKYLHLTTCDFKLDYYDFQNIINTAQSKFVNDKFPVHLGQQKKKVLDKELANLCLIEAAISYFHKNNCFKKRPIFDKREGKL